MKKNTAPIPFAGSQLGECRHVCAFFNNDEEEYRVLLQFIKDGFDSGDKVIHVVNPDQHNDHLNRLKAAGIDTESALERGQFELRTNTEVYVRDGRFDQNRMLEVFEKLASDSVTEGFPRSRIVCHMDWAVDAGSHVDNLIEFESRVNDVWLRHEDAVICTYNLTKFSADAVIDLMRTHPMIIIGGMLQQNPFYVPPEEFLREFRERRSMRSAASSTVTSIDEPLEDSTKKIRRLQHCINDLVSVLALPAIWTGGDPSQVVNTLLEAVKGMLDLDFVYVRLNGLRGEAIFETVRGTQSKYFKDRPREFGELIGGWLGDEAKNWPLMFRRRIDDSEFSIVPLRMGLQGEVGIIVAGSQREDFPEQTERLVLSVAANQAAIWLHEIRLLSEQRIVASELDRRVAQRTKELDEANEELQIQVGLLQRLPVAAWTLRPDGTPDFVNQIWLEYTGQTLEFVRSNPEAWMAAIHPEDRERSSGIFRDGVQSGQDFTIEARFRRMRDGTYRWHLNRAVAIRDVDGRLLRFVGTSTDIEDIKQSQQDLLRAEEKTRLIIDTALDAVITMNAQGEISSWNKQAEVIFGWSNSEATGRKMSEMIIPEHQRIAHERGLRHFFATGEGPMLGRRIEVTALRRNGEEFPVELEIVPMRLGQDWFFSSFLRDITHSKEAEEELRRSEAFLAQGQRLTLIGSFAWCIDTGEFTFSEQLYDTFEFEPAAPVTIEMILSRVHPDDVPIVQEIISRAQSAMSDFSYEHRLLMPDESIKYVRVIIHGCLDNFDRLEYIGAVQDVTERRLAEEALSKVRSELAHVARVTSLGALTASIAHEVNQPLSGIVTNASTCLRMLAADPPNIDGALETARRTIRDGNRASEVIARLRALFTRKETSIEAVDLNEATREVIALSLSEIQRSRVVLRQELADDLAPVIGDRVQLQQVILNLLLNAADAMSGIDDRPRQLLVRTERDGSDRVRLTVQDSGVGVDPKNLDKMFESFYTTKSAGMGIGLSVSRTIIESHHGRLWATPNDGPGATLAFSIPREPGNTAEMQNEG